MKTGDKAPQGGMRQVDVHGKNQYQTRVMIDSALRRADNSVYRLRVIHGQTHGSVLKEMIREQYAEHPRVIRVVAGQNDGQTDLILKEPYRK